jgi:hypothetical protein
MDALALRVQQLAGEAAKSRRARSETFALIWQAACLRPQPAALAAPQPIPHFSEPWYCCAEPTEEHFAFVNGTEPDQTALTETPSEADVLT